VKTENLEADMTILSKEKSLALLRLTFNKIENGWTKGAFAKNAENKIVNFDDKSAQKFCLYGAIKNSALELDINIKEIEEIVSKLTTTKTICLPEFIRKQTPWFVVSQWNDSVNTKIEDVLSLLKRLIIAIDNNWD